MIVRDPETHFEPAPAGLHQAICVDVVDMGEVETAWGAQRRMRIVWQIDVAMEDGRRFQVAKFYKPSLHPKAILRQDLISWQGRQLNTEELTGFDTEDLVGEGCQLNVTHRPGNDGRTWSNVTSVVPLPPGVDPLIPQDYIRARDRQNQTPVPF